MIIILIIVGLALAAAGLLLTVNRYLQALPENRGKTPELPPREPAGLFAVESPSDEPKADAAEESESRRKAIVERASLSDLGALTEAQAEDDGQFYARVLDTLIDAFERQAALPLLVKQIANSKQLRGSSRMAEKVIQSWKLAPGRRSTIEMIHIAALSDDPEVYGKAVELALEAWRDERLSELKPEELAELVESQYWVLATEARCGGAGYALKRRVANARRVLAQTPVARG